MPRARVSVEDKQPTVEMAIDAFKAILMRQLEEVREELVGDNERTLVTLVQLAEQTVAVITPTKTAAWYAQTHGYLIRCLNRVNIY